MGLISTALEHFLESAVKMVNKQKFKYLVLAMILLVAVLIIRFGVLGGDEDTWICDEGQWVRHGNPTASRPTTPCSR